MNRTLAVVAVFFAAFAANAQTDVDDELPVLPAMPLVQDCENLREAYLRLAARLRREGTADEADTAATRGRLLYDDCLDKSFSGGSGMGG